MERRRQEEAREEADAMVSYNKQFDLRVRTDTYIHGRALSGRSCSSGVCARIAFILNFKYPSHIAIVSLLPCCMHIAL